MSDENDKQTLGTIVSLNKIKQTANRELGITQTYNKENRDKLWDSTNGKSEYKDKVFGDKQSYKDSISGNTLHKSQKAAQKKFRMKNSAGENVSSKWAEHSAEVDHVKALKDAHDIAKHNPFLTDGDFKEIMNSEENYRVLSKSDNASKGKQSDWEIILDKDSKLSAQGKAQIAKEKITSDIKLQGKFVARTAQNVGKEFVSGATDVLVNSAIPLTAEAVRKMIKVAQGEESAVDAAKSMGKIVVKTAVAGGKNKLMVDVVSAQLANSKNVFLKNLANTNQVAQLIAVATIVQESAVRYINGEIDGNEFINEVGEKGVTMVVGMIGGQVGSEIGSIIGGLVGTVVLPGAGTAAGCFAGAVIGEIIGAMITTIACSAIVSVFNTIKHLNDYKLKESQIRRLESDALEEMKNQRLKFREIVEHECRVWDETIQSGFDQMLRCACEETYNLQGMTKGLDKILSVFGKQVAFKSLDEYENQLNMPLKLNF